MSPHLTSSLLANNCLHSSSNMSSPCTCRQELETSASAPPCTFLSPPLVKQNTAHKVGHRAGC
eukprot:767024-Hanusia_phi.AAC.2